MTQIDGGGTCSSISAQLYIHKSLIAGEPNDCIVLCRTSRTSEMSGFDTSVPHFSGIHSLHGGGIRDIESVMYRRLIAVRILIGVVPSLKIAH